MMLAAANTTHDRFISRAIEGKAAAAATTGSALVPALGSGLSQRQSPFQHSAPGGHTFLLPAEPMGGKSGIIPRHHVINLQRT